MYKPDLPRPWPGSKDPANLPGGTAFNYGSDRGRASDIGLLIVGHPEALLHGVVEDLMHKLRPQQDFAPHQCQNPATAVVQPVDRAAANIFGHARDTIIVRPTVVAVEVALPFGEQVRNDGMEIARLYARPDIRGSHPRNARRITGNVTLVR